MSTRTDDRRIISVNYKIPSDASPEERETITAAIREATVAEREKQLAIDRLGSDAALKTANSLENAILKVRKDRKIS
jgi:hypothetical protein